MKQADKIDQFMYGLLFGPVVWTWVDKTFKLVSWASIIGVVFYAESVTHSVALKVASFVLPIILSIGSVSFTNEILEHFNVEKRYGNKPLPAMIVGLALSAANLAFAYYVAVFVQAFLKQHGGGG